MRKLKRGQIFLNLWAGYQTLFVFTNISHYVRENEIAHGICLTKIDGKYKVRRGRYHVSDLKNDEEHFPLVGEMDIKAMWIERMLERITVDGIHLLYEKYDEMGHRKCDT